MATNAFNYYYSHLYASETKRNKVRREGRAVKGVTPGKDRTGTDNLLLQIILWTLVLLDFVSAGVSFSQAVQYVTLGQTHPTSQRAHTLSS